MIRLLLLIMLPLSAFAQDIPVKDSLAGLIEDAVVKTNFDINIVPKEMTETSVNISSINGVSVCDASNKTNVQALQDVFSKDKRLHQTISTYGVYLNKDGAVKFLPGDNPKIKALIGECKYLYVSVP